MPDAYILGIESSCDETAAAVVRSGEKVVSNVVASQIATHGPYGGVVPELASREHLRAMVPVVRQGAWRMPGRATTSVDALAVTQGPGLAGALLVGISYAKALAFALDKPLIAVNHLEGHIHAVLLEERQKGGFSGNGDRRTEFSGAGVGGFGRTYAFVFSGAEREQLDLPEHWAHAR
jgi:N6-L-threonylcarbamoyladenine synthase